MYKPLCIRIYFYVVLLSNAAGSNGMPQEDKIYYYTRHHVWDDEVNVKDIIVTIGKTLKLENVSLNSIGSIQIHGETEWLNSTIYHDKRDLEDNISLYSKLEIISTELLMNATDSYDGSNANVFYNKKQSLLSETMIMMKQPPMIALLSKK